jgi:hypothetical protein
MSTKYGDIPMQHAVTPGWNLLAKRRSSFGRCCTPTRFLRLKKRCNRRCVGHAESPQSSRKFEKIGHFAGGETQTLPLSLDARSEAPRIFPIRPELNIQLINYRVGSGVPRSLYRWGRGANQIGITGLDQRSTEQGINVDGFAGPSSHPRPGDDCAQSNQLPMIPTARKRRQDCVYLRLKVGKVIVDEGRQISGDVVAKRQCFRLD